MSGFQMVGTSTPFENRTKMTIWNPDMSGFRIPTVLQFLKGVNKFDAFVEHLSLWFPDTWLGFTDKVNSTVGIWNPTLRNSESFENRTFWRLVFEWSGFQMVGTIALKLWSQPFENRTKQNGGQEIMLV